jgi:hypothetical protein
VFNCESGQRAGNDDDDAFVGAAVNADEMREARIKMPSRRF